MKKILILCLIPLMVVMLSFLSLSKDKKVVKNNSSVSLVNPNVGNVCSKTLSWKNNIISAWRNNPDNSGVDDKFTMEIKIPHFKGTPYLEIITNKEWPQPYIDKSGDNFKFEVYLHHGSNGSHKFNLYNNSKKERLICNWIIDK